MLEASGRASADLRRYRFADASIGHYHDTSTHIGEEPYDPERIDGDRHPHTDPRWPLKCACGYVFKETDAWQRTHRLLWKRVDLPLERSLLVTLDEAPAGAMWFADWLSDHWKGPDGKCLVVKLPDGTDWTVDGPANNAPGKLPGWDRSGTPPLVVVRPSIATPNYHGFLGGPGGDKPGVLVSC